MERATSATAIEFNAAGAFKKVDDDVNDALVTGHANLNFFKDQLVGGDGGLQ